MQIGDVCTFQVCGHRVICECWDGYDGVAYGVTVLNPEGKELFHTGSTDKIDTYDKSAHIDEIVNDTEIIMKNIYKGDEVL